jgi:RsiW-degrading membrane proteinase PrsW (M82 family)
MLLIIPVLALAPGIFWLWLAYRWDKYQPEPKWLVIRTFLYGMAVVLPVLGIELLLGLIHFGAADTAQTSVSNMAWGAFVVAGFTEELGKFLVVYLTMYKSRYFDESTDGIIYASAAALGFASLENLMYMIGNGWQIILLRAPISTFSHLLFAVLWGYPLILRKLGRPGATALLFTGLIGAMAFHGLFDFVVFTKSWYAFMFIPIMAALIVVFILMLRHSRKISAFRKETVQVTTVTCQNCGAVMNRNARFCTACGRRLLESDNKQKPAN